MASSSTGVIAGIERAYGDLAEEEMMSIPEAQLRFCGHIDTRRRRARNSCSSRM
jgi:hypothetical protein